MKIRHEFIRASRDFFNSRDFTLVDAPIFTPSACEGTTTLFEVPYFDDGTKAYLSQSGQLYMEACAYAFQKVYSLGPTFRAEKSKTRRHLTEFWMIEPEVLFYTLDDIMKLCEAYLSYCIERVLHECAFEFTLLERDTQKLKNVTPPFPRITYDEAIIQINNLLQKEGSTKVIQWGDDFGAEEESILSKQYTKPLFVYNFPLAIKAFYMKASLDRSDVALGVDCLAPEGYGEIIGGGEREDRYDVLLTKLIEYGIKKDDVTPSDMDWYLDLRKYGSVPHGGFGLGIERALSWITGVEHVRETSPFPRMMYRIKP